MYKIFLFLLCITILFSFFYYTSLQLDTFNTNQNIDNMNSGIGFDGPRGFRGDPGPDRDLNCGELSDFTTVGHTHSVYSKDNHTHIEPTNILEILDNFYNNSQKYEDFKETLHNIKIGYSV